MMIETAAAAVVIRSLIVWSCRSGRSITDPPCLALCCDTMCNAMRCDEKKGVLFPQLSIIITEQCSIR